VGHSTLFKRFIQRAASHTWEVDGVEIQYGPDATDAKLAPSLRAGDPGCHLAACTVRTAEGLAMAAATAAGECPPEVLLDWLKDKDHFVEG
jgi:hypothetical protein